MASGEAGDDAVGEREKVHRDGVDVESFVIEVHDAAIDHGSKTLQGMSNHTLERLDSVRDRASEGMRGHDSKQASMLCLVSPESVVPVGA